MSVIQKAFIAIIIALTATAALYGCRARQPVNTPVPTPYLASTTQPGTPSIPSVAPDKTASQDTAGDTTTIPEAATAAGATAKIK